MQMQTYAADLSRRYGHSLTVASDNKPFTLAVSNIYKAGGFREFYKGLWSSLTGNTENVTFGL